MYKLRNLNITIGLGITVIVILIVAFTLFIAASFLDNRQARILDGGVNDSSGRLRFVHALPLSFNGIYIYKDDNGLEYIIVVTDTGTSICPRYHVNRDFKE